MSFFNLFEKRIIIDDEFFGEIRFFRIKNKSLDGYFEGFKHFSPLQKDIELSLDANEVGPTQKQKDFYLDVEAKYHLLINDIKIELEELFRNIIDSFIIKNFHNEFNLIGITLPNFIESPLEWELTYETIHDKNHIFTICYEDWNIESIRMDG